MTYTLADDRHHQILAEFMVTQHHSIQQAYDWLRSKRSIVRGYKYRYAKVLAIMHLLYEQE